MISSKEIFMQDRESETFEAPKSKKITSLPTTVKQGNELLQKIRQKRLLIIETEKKLVEHINRIAFAFENPKNLHQSVITDMAMNPDAAYYYVSKINKWEYHRARYRGPVDQLRHVERNPFFDWDSEKGKDLLRKEKRIDDQE